MPPLQTRRWIWFGAGLLPCAEVSPAVLPNACFPESVIFVENHLAHFPKERADAFNFVMSEVGLPFAAGAHTIAIYTTSGKLWGYDYTLGSFIIGDAQLLGTRERLNRHVLDAYRKMASHAAKRARLGYCRNTPVLLPDRDAVLLAAERLKPFSRWVGDPQILRFQAGEKECFAVLFCFKGHLCLYQPDRGTQYVKPAEDESIALAASRLPALQGATSIEVLR